MSQHTRTAGTRGPSNIIRLLVGVFVLMALGLVVVKVIVPAVLGTNQQTVTQSQPAQNIGEVVSEPVAVEEPPADLSTFAGQLSAGQVSSIRVVGDSITAGYLINGFDDESDTGVVVYDGGEGTYYETPTYVRCWTNLFREYAAGRGVGSFVNAGVSGFRMSYLADEPSSWLGDGADVIVVMLGTNDAAKESIEDFRYYAEAALTAASERCSHLVVVSPPNNERTDAENLYGMDQIDQVLTELCAEHGWEHVSLYDVLSVYTDDFFDDEVHPSEQGSSKLWSAFHDRLGLA
ncbi:MAG: SGNH/GDSL hydrolase family protein [Atopobiaceae bacterium]|nr:SGNH/GDSL hydrolase family protein [Atopobiaceae bacterium]MDO4404998.1 SGNH/GDSL hydrolase family protein [Atopobiaceae bacterium]